jgi:hypothetical protein
LHIIQQDNIEQNIYVINTSVSGAQTSISQDSTYFITIVSSISAALETIHMGLERFRLIFLIKSVKTTLPDSPMDQWLDESQRRVSAVKVDDRPEDIGAALTGACVAVGVAGGTTSSELENPLWAGVLATRLQQRRDEGIAHEGVRVLAQVRER